MSPPDDAPPPSSLDEGGAIEATGGPQRYEADGTARIPSKHPRRLTERQLLGDDIERIGTLYALNQADVIDAMIALRCLEDGEAERHLRRAFGNRGAIGQVFGVGPGAVGHWCTNRSVPPLDVLVRVGRLCRVLSQSELAYRAQEGER